MNNRTTVTLVLSIALIILVMGAAVLMTIWGTTDVAHYTTQALWTAPYGGVESMKIIDLDGDGRNDLFVQQLDRVVILDTAGQELFQQEFSTPIATTMGDLDGDAVEDVIIFAPGSAVMVLDRGQVGSSFVASGVSWADPSRTAILRFASGAQVVLGDTNGILAGYARSGELIWSSNVLYGDYIRGLDDAQAGGELFLAAGNYSGAVALFDAEGQVSWNYVLGENLRRLRAYDLDSNGDSEILLGGENGRLVFLQASSGAVLADVRLGQRVTEIRDAELDGDPGAREVVIGGRDGGVWGYRRDGERLFSRSLGERVNEIAGIDLDDDGQDEILIGDESGKLSVVSNNGRTSAKTFETGSAILRVDAGRLTSSDQVAVGDGSQVQVFTLNVSSPGLLRFLPLLVGLLVSALVVLLAWFIATLPARPELRVALQDGTPEGLQAQRRMLKETIADLERLRGSSEIAADPYLARLRSLRQELAENEAALRKAGVKITPETFNCPNCGGTLLLGQDKCDYCNQVVLT